MPNQEPHHTPSSHPDLDEQIRRAVCEEDADLFESGDETFREFVSAAFKGRFRWLMLLTAFWSLVFFIVAIVAGIRFFDTDSTRDQIMWVAIFLFSMQAVGLLKQWHWMQMDRLSIIREVKRLELQVARLSHKQDA